MNKLICKFLKNLLLLLVFSSVSCTGCFKRSNSKNRKGSKDSSAGLIIKDDISVARTFTRKAAVVRFRTQAPALCSFKIWAQDENESPSKETPRQIDCENEQELKEFNELITNLAPDILYSIEITAWEKAKGEDTADHVIVNENESSNQEQVSDPTPKALTDGVYVVRFNVPLLMGEVHKYNASKELDTSDIQTTLRRELGCKAGTVEISSFETSSKKFNLTKISTQRYGLGEGKIHPYYQDRMQLIYQSLQSGDRWEWFLALDGKNDHFIAKQPAEFIKVSMESGSSKDFGTPQLKNAENPLDIDSTKDLTVKWSAENLTAISYVRVQISYADNPKAILCHFRASKEAGTIEANLLSGLGSGKHDILVGLESSQVQTIENKVNAIWLIQSYDWRLSRINKL